MKTTEKPTILYEDAAEFVTVTGWACKTCRLWYGQDERAARWCCATDLPCECGGRRVKTYTVCEECRAKKDAERWAARERREWTGDEPLYSEFLERYIFDSDDLETAQEEAEGADLLLVFCEPQYPSVIEDDYWCDELPEDETLEDAAPDIAAAVYAANRVILQRRYDGEPLSWTPGNVAAVVSDEDPKP